MQAQTTETVLVPHIAPHEKAQSAEHDKHHQRDVHERILRPADERPERVVRRAHQVETGVAERRNRVEHAHRDALSEPVQRHEPAGQQHSARTLDGERAKQHAPCQAHDAAAVRQIEARAHHHALVQRKCAPQHERGDGGHGHKAQSADLDEQQDDALAEHRPVHGCADRDESGNAARRSRSEQRIEKGRSPSVRRRTRQHEHQRARQYSQRKAQREHSRRTQTGMAFFFCKQPRGHGEHPPFDDKSADTKEYAESLNAPFRLWTEHTLYNSISSLFRPCNIILYPNFFEKSSHLRNFPRKNKQGLSDFQQIREPRGGSAAGKYSNNPADRDLFHSSNTSTPDNTA